jgi:hypothetical protein
MTIIPSTSTALPSSPFAAQTQARTARRLSRIAAGTLMVAGALVGVPALIIASWAGSTPAEDTGAHVAWLFLALMIVPVLVGFAVHQIVRVLPTRWFVAMAEQGAVASFVVPAVGVALVFPLGLQAMPILVLSGLLSQEIADFYGAVAGLGTLHAHVAFAILMACDARRASAGLPRKNNHAILIPAALTCLPGILWVFPPFLVAVIAWMLQRSFLHIAASWLQGDRCV